MTEDQPLVAPEEPRRHKKECAYSGLPLSTRGGLPWPAARGEDMCICEPEPIPDDSGVDDKERGLYPKYRVYKYTPNAARSMELVTAPCFVLLPETDPHARLALRAYSTAVFKSGYYKLSQDINKMLRKINPG